MSMRNVYSVVTDLARFRGKSTSTPFMIARSIISGIKDDTYGMRGAEEE